MKWDNQPAIVELFGHQIIAGRITEEEHIGSEFLRVDVPGEKGFTKFFGSGAVYGVTPTDEVTMLAAVESLTYKPVSVYIAPARQLPIPEPKDYELAEDSLDLWEGNPYD